MAMIRNKFGHVVFTDCRLFRAGVIEMSGFELGLPAADKRTWFNTYYSAAGLSNPAFLKAFERLPVVSGHRNEIEARHREGFSSAARFDGEWVIADLTMTTQAVKREIFVHHVTDLSASISGNPSPWNGAVLDGGIEKSFEYGWWGLKPMHIALVPIGRVVGAELNW